MTKKLLNFFSMAFVVKNEPAVGDYCKLWSMWQRTNNFTLRHKDCSTFWEFICKHWNSETQQLLSGCITKVPAHYEGKIMLVEKQDVFIPDDLLLEDLFDKQAKQPLFVWYPSAGTTFLSRTKLNDIYSSIGVKKISKVVLKEECKSITLDSVTTTPTGTVIKPGLLRIVLAFLANPTIGISAEKRHQMVSSLTSVALKGLSRPFDINYRVTLSSGRTIVVKSAGKFRWERENSSCSCLSTMDR